MGNKLGRKRQVVDEKYTRPQGLYQHKDVDHKKLRKLILESKLAPCFPGDDDCGCDLEECPICFLYYPSLNRSRCCMKGICTECFLQMRTPNSTRPTQCPFCKTSNYAVEFRGVKSKEEKGLEQIEEQRVIEAKIRMRQKEVQDEENKMLKRREVNTSSSMRGLTEVDYCTTATASSHTSALQSEEIIASLESNASIATKQPPLQRHNREGEFDIDLEDIMVMEAIWLSIQESGQRHQTYSDSGQPEEYNTDCHRSLAVMAPVSGPSSSSPSGGLACAIAALAERQQTSEEISISYENAITASPDNQLVISEDAGEWVDHRSEMAEVGTSYGGSDEFDNATRPGEFFHQDVNHGSFLPVTDTIIPDSYEERMMLAMAVSLAETGVRTSIPGVAWH